MKKKIIALLTLLVLLVGMFSVSEAAVKPTASVRAGSQNQTVKLGKTASFIFDLNAGTYNKVGDVFRAKLISKVTKGKQTAGVASWVFTGKQVYKLRVKIDKKAPTGKYKLSYTTYYRKKDAAKWVKVKTQSTKFTVKK